MKSRMTQAAAVAATVLMLAPVAVSAAAADDHVVMLRVDVNGTDKDTHRVKISVPLSLLEVVVESVDTTQVMRDLKSDKGIDIKKLWRELRKADVDEFVSIDKDDAKIKVYKDRDLFRITVQEENFTTPNIEIRIPFSVMDYLTDDHDDGFKLSEMIAGIHTQLPLTIIEAQHDGENVKVWLEEK